jgi:hypothetical protein
VLPRGKHQVIGGIVVHEECVRAQPGAGIEPLEEVVAQQRVLGHPVGQRRLEGVHVIDPLPDVTAFVEQVLIHIRHGRRVRVDSNVP